MLLKIAFKNLINTGARLWINVVIISISICLVLWIEALYTGFTINTINIIKSTETGAGQLLSPGFDPDDSLTWMESSSPIPKILEPIIRDKKIFPVRFTPAVLYFKEKNLHITMKSMPSDQNAIKIDIPSKGFLFYEKHALWPANIGIEMSKKINCLKGDILTLTWKNSKGAYDAADFRVQQIMNTSNPRIENMSIWLETKVFEKLMNESGRASYLVLAKNSFNQVKTLVKNIKQKWILKTPQELTQWIVDLSDKKRKNTKIIYLLLVFLCSVGLFNSQVTAVFKRQKEIGIFMAMGLNNFKISLIFALEGIITALIAIFLVPIIGFPLFYWSAVYGINATYTQGMGVPMPESLKSVYTFSSSISTLMLFIVILTLISWVPVHKILSFKPADLVNKK